MRALNDTSLVSGRVWVTFAGASQVRGVPTPFSVRQRVTMEDVIPLHHLSQVVDQKSVMKWQGKPLLVRRGQQDGCVSFAVVARWRRFEHSAVRRIVGQAEPVAVALNVVVADAGTFR